MNYAYFFHYHKFNLIFLDLFNLSNAFMGVLKYKIICR